MHSDPILREVHRMKDQCARQYNYDLNKIFAHLREEAEKHPERMVYPPSDATAPIKPRATARKNAK